MLPTDQSPDYYRVRADEELVKAKAAKSETASRIHLELADRYISLAARAEG